MPLISTQDAIGASATIFPWQGSQYEWLRFNALIQVAALAVTASAVQASIFSGSDVLMQDSILDILPLATAIQYPEDFPLEDVAAAGERLGMRATDVGGAGDTLRTRVRITPL